MRYSDTVIADFKLKKQNTAFSLDKKSWLRVVVNDPPGTNVDVLLAKDNKEVTRSNVVGEIEGILVELEAGSYVVTFSVENSILTRRTFCETFVLEIGISPSTAVKAFNDFYDLESCDDTESLDDALDSIESALKRDKKTAVNVDPTSFYKVPISSMSKGNLLVYEHEFTVPSRTLAYFGKT